MYKIFGRYCKVNKSILSFLNILIMCEFQDVFLDNLPRLAPKKDIEFSIDLAPKTMFISKTPYKMVPIELRELKKQL